MKITKSLDEGLLKLGIDGDLDASSAVQVDDVIQSAFDEERYHILVDCKDLKYISSAGLGVFISHLEDFKSKSGAFVFYHMNDNVYNVFQLLGLHQLFAIVTDETEAKDVFSRS